MNLTSKLNTTSLLVGIFSALTAGIAIGWISSGIGQEVIEDQAKSHLVAIREAKKYQIEDYFKILHGQMRTYSKDQIVIEAAENLSKAFRNYRNELGEKISEIQEDNLKAFYTNVYYPEYQKHSPGAKLDIQKLLEPLTSNSVAMQTAYLIANRNTLAKKDRLNDPDDGTAYSRLHKTYHPQIREFARTFGYYDIFVVEPENGDIIYSVGKEIDFATSLLNGPYAKSKIGQVFRLANQAANSDYIALSDFAPYTPSYGKHAGFMASPIFNQGEKIGVLIFQMPIDRINAIMTSDQRWAVMGLGQSGETYLVGEDQTMRSQSRFLIQDKAQYLAALTLSDTPRAVIETISARNSSIGLQPVKTKPVDAALRGESGLEIVSDYRNITVLSAYSPAEIEGLKWAIMSEMDEREAFAYLYTLNNRILISTLSVLALTALFVGLLCWYLAVESRDRPEIRA